MDAVLFDFRKAFDSIPHRLLLNKLTHLGLNENIVCWVANYLRSGHQIVVNGSTSGSSSVLIGIPQGSVLEPLLFLI